jgi:glucosamine--fructose-6-phosphate aminotransferase (isomerizing)
MFREAQESAAVVERQHRLNAGALRQLGERLRRDPPRAVVTLARGSSDHAATFARYLIERRARVLTSSLSPSIASIYNATPTLTGTVALAISQSGRSPDLLIAAEQARQMGAFVVAFVNDENAPLAGLADVALPLAAGREQSVAASKSFIATLAATLDLLTSWTEDRSLEAALSTLPDKLDRAWEADWTPAVEALQAVDNAYVVARGHGLGVAQEAALKLKETCGLHAEGFSGAELRHGPMALVRRDFPVVMFAQGDETLPSMSDLAAAMSARGASVISSGIADAAGIRLPTIPTDPLIAPIVQVASFYRAANALALARGFDPDRPANLSKITETR